MSPEKVWLIRWGLQVVRLSRVDHRPTFWVASDAEFTEKHMLQNGIAPYVLYEFTTAEQLLEVLERATRPPGTVVVWEVPRTIAEVLTPEQAFDLGTALRISKTLLHVLTTLPEATAQESMASVFERDHRENGELWKTFMDPQLIL